MKYVAYWRTVAGKSQKKLGKEIGISQGHVCDIERRGIKPRPVLYPKLAEALGRPVEEVVAVLNGVRSEDMSIPAFSK